jgi:putative protease
VWTNILSSCIAIVSSFNTIISELLGYVNIDVSFRFAIAERAKFFWFFSPKEKNSKEKALILPELLSPAGDMERLEAAVMYGADAVYLGGKDFGMRGAPKNFEPRELADAVRFCHRQDVKVYLTCNTLPTNAEVVGLPFFLTSAAEAGVDALIVADIGVLMLAKRLLPNMEIHVSTQAGVVNYLTARELHSLGASRVILARELPLDDVARIRDKTPPELAIEAFVHGAMCMSFSGRCLISQYMTGRDGNRGQCAQPCRWSYQLMEEKRQGEYFPVIENEEGSFILNAQDLSMLPYIDRLARAGISSFKIEGRAKSAYYVAAITNAYRIALDLYAESPGDYLPPDWLVEETRKVSHREYSTGFYFPEKPPGQFYDFSGYVRDWELAAIVLGYEDGYLLVEERGRFLLGSELELLEPGRKPEAFTVTEILDDEGLPQQSANHPMRRYRIPFHRPVPKGAYLRRQLDQRDAGPTPRSSL